MQSIANEIVRNIREYISEYHKETDSFYEIEIDNMFYQVDFTASIDWTEPRFEGDHLQPADKPEIIIHFKEIEIRDIYDSEGNLANENLKTLNDILWKMY